MANQQANESVAEQPMPITPGRGLQTLSEITQDGLFVKDGDLQDVYVNPAMKRFLAASTEGQDRSFSFDQDRLDRQALAGEANESDFAINHSGAAAWFHISRAPVRNQRGEIIGICGIVRDTTQIRKLRDQLARAQRMEAIGSLAGGIAHDFNNLLMSIQGNVSLMLLDIDNLIEEQVASGSKLTRQLLRCSSEGRHRFESLDLNRVIEETSYAFGRARKEISIRSELMPDLARVKADKSDLEQALMNLFVNAGEAMPTGGDLVIGTINVMRKDHKDPSGQPRLLPYVKMTVSDSGVGMDEATQQRIFEPEFTTKKGSGLGLTSVYGIVESHGGYIEVESAPAKGTTFLILLPAIADRTEEQPLEPPPPAVGGGNILVVDDEEMILEVEARMIARLGHTVIKARGGREALQRYRDRQQEFDLVILDMVMPGMGGGETFDELRRLNPEIPVLLATGYDLDGEAAEIIARGCNGVIQKPFTISEVALKLEQTLAGSAGSN